MVTVARSVVISTSTPGERMMEKDSRDSGNSSSRMGTVREFMIAPGGKKRSPTPVRKKSEPSSEREGTYARENGRQKEIKEREIHMLS